jgi:peptidyl-prolyl cis-trans isomerase SurA
MKTMNPLIRHLIVLICCLGGLLAHPVSAAPEPVIEADRIVAVVGDDVITYFDLRTRLAAALKQLQKQGTPLPPQEELERQMLERLIMERVQLQYARESGLKIDDTQLDQAIGRIAAGNKMTPQQFRTALEKDGVQYAQFREEIRNEMVTVRLREREVDSKLVVSDGEIDNYLADQAAKGGGEEVSNCTHSPACAGVSQPRTAAKTAFARRASLKRAQAGENFAELTATFSDAPDALKGGDLGWRPLDRMPALYAEVSARLQPGQVSELLRSSAGFHIIKLLNKRGGSMPASVQQTHARHILIRINEVVSEAEARHKLEAFVNASSTVSILPNRPPVFAGWVCREGRGPWLAFSR